MSTTTTLLPLLLLYCHLQCCSLPLLLLLQLLPSSLLLLLHYYYDYYYFYYYTTFNILLPRLPFPMFQSCSKCYSKFLLLNINNRRTIMTVCQCVDSLNDTWKLILKCQVGLVSSDEPVHTHPTPHPYPSFALEMLQFVNG